MAEALVVGRSEPPALGRGLEVGIWLWLSCSHTAAFKGPEVRQIGRELMLCWLAGIDREDEMSVHRFVLLAA